MRGEGRVRLPDPGWLGVGLRRHRALVGTGSLSGGVATNSTSYSSGYADACVFTYSVPDVPASDYYRVKVGNSSDSGVPFTAEQVDGDAHIRFGTP